MNNEIEELILKLYRDIKLGDSSICQLCRKECDLSRPIGCWLVGDRFMEHDKRILFVGKNARGNAERRDETLLDTFAISRDVLWKQTWPYWDYTAEITIRIFGEDSPEHIAITNMVKCNNSDDVDTTPKSVKDRCICGMKVLSKEIDIIKPTHMIFYTSKNYDDYIPKVFDSFEILKNTKKQIGAKEMPWLEAEAILKGRKIKVLRVGHPERMKKTDYINAVCDWIMSV